MGLALVTWNVHGSGRPDLDRLAARLDALDADVVALQEVQRRQADTVARSLRWTAHWSFKHWPIGNPAEGLALLSPHRFLEARTLTLSTGAPFWSYRRRVAQLCALVVGGQAFRVANCHLASDDVGARRAQAARLLAELAPDSVVAGDLNARPSGTLLRRLAAAGLRDAWAENHPVAAATEGATNWGRRDPDTAPSNRLDYILVPRALRIVGVTVPSAQDDLLAYRRLSDHLPVRAELEIVGRD